MKFLQQRIFSALTRVNRNYIVLNLFIQHYPVHICQLLSEVTFHIILGLCRHEVVYTQPLLRMPRPRQTDRQRETARQTRNSIQIHIWHNFSANVSNVHADSPNMKRQCNCIFKFGVFACKLLKYCLFLFDGCACTLLIFAA